MQDRGLQKESKMQIKAVHMVTVNALPSNDMRLHGTFCKSSVLSVLLLARIIVLEAPPLPGKKDKLRILAWSFATQKSQHFLVLINGLFRLIFTLGCLHYTPPSAASPYSGRWPSTVDSTHVAKLSRRGWSFNYEHFNFQQLLNCTASYQLLTITHLYCQYFNFQQSLSPVLPILVALAPMARIENHISSSKI